MRKLVAETVFSQSPVIRKGNTMRNYHVVKMAMAIAMAIGALGCGETAVDTDVEKRQDAVSLTSRAIRFQYSGACWRKDGSYLNQGPCSIPGVSEQKFTFVQTGAFYFIKTGFECVYSVTNPIDGVRVRVGPCSSSRDEYKWRIYPGSGTFDTTFRLQNHAPNQLCAHADVLTYTVADVRQRSCTNTWEHQNVFFDDF